MTRPASTRRLFLVGVAGLTGFSGCNVGRESTTRTETDTRTPAASQTSTPADATTATATAAAEPSLSLPDRVLVDDTFALRLTGIEESQTLEVRVETTDTGGTTWRSSATFRAPGRTFDLDEATLLDGPFGGDLPTSNTMALLQFLGPIGEPAMYRPKSEETLSIVASADGTELASASFSRVHGSPDLDQLSLDHDTLAGTLFEPPEQGPAPGVVVLHASDGRPDTFLARMLATHGFAALALRYFGPGTPTEQLFEIPVEYVGTAVEWLLGRDGVTGRRVGLVGDSKGGELALLAGSELDGVGPVVSRNGSGVVWPGFSSEGFNAGSSWTVNGTGVPFVPYVEDPDLWSEGPLEPAYTKSLEEATVDQVREATIPVEEIQGPILFVSGSDDAVWDAQRLQERAVDRLEAVGRDDYDHLVYEDAGHVTTIPYRPVVELEARTPLTIGGTPAGHAHASAGHWPRVLETLGTLR